MDVLHNSILQTLEHLAIIFSAQLFRKAVENVNARRIYRKKGHDQRGEQHGTAAP
jgi:hypothetical protein